ncbi:MAG: carbohydrate-binding domain-containing protein [Clostridia bacterium]|nr:carbohydrate-binding domain-containing protein [Clostridia bacterium]
MLKKVTAMLLAALFCFGCTACSSTTTSSGSGTAVTETSSTASVILDPSEMFTDRDYETDYSNYITINLSDGASAADGNGVTITDDVITITKEGTYLLTGTLSDGQVIVDVDDTQKVQLVLDNASISNSSTAALYVRQADKVFLTTASDSENTLVSSGDFSDSDEESNIDGTIFSKGDLTLNGNGSLSVSCSMSHAIVSKDDLKITSGTYTISSAKQGLSGKDSVRIADGNITIESDTDGIHSENTDNTEKGFIFICGGTLNITSSNDALDASNYIAVIDGTLNLTTGGGSENTTKVQSGEFTGQGFGSFEPRSGNMGEMPADTANASEMVQPQDGANPPDDMPADGNLPDDTAPQTDAVASSDTSGSADTASDTESETTAASDTESETTTASDSYKGIKADTAIEITGGIFTIDSADDAVHTNGSLSISGGTL